MRRNAMAVTGLGLVTPAGIGVADSWARVCAGVPTAACDPALDGCPVPISCRVPGFDPGALLGGKAARRFDRFVQFALVAAREALADAHLDRAGWDGARVGVVLGCAEGGPATLEEQHRTLIEDAPTSVSPHLLPMQLPNMVAGCVSMEFCVTGPSMVVTTACASGTTAIGLAHDLLDAGRCDVVLTGGSEAMVTPLFMAAFARMGALSRRVGDPPAASRPFDSGRDGFVAAEGCAVLVVERMADARARGAHVRALVTGYGGAADAYHVTAPDPSGRGLEQALRAALADAGAAPADVKHVNAHGTATQQGDIIEARVLRRVLGDHPVVSSTKGVTGHMFGAAGAVEAAFTVLAVEHGFIPPTANLDRPDPRIEVGVTATGVRRRVDCAVSTSAGFGGQNAALVVTAA